uniref:DUF4376 domain-containing protein n=1 Tax=Halomonas sp. TaxID=1486246 RepID=UPI00260B568F|nr:DUF4376 domain-containing protein [Halomonas sp.]
MFYFSARENAFFPFALKGDYDQAGTWPDDAIELREDELLAYVMGEAPTGYRLGSDGNGRPTWTPIPPIPIEKLATLKRSEIDSALIMDLEKGMPWTMPDGTKEVVQTRPQDEPNLIRLAIEARDLRDQDITVPAQYIRVLSNRMYQLTPGQMIELTDSATAFKKQLQDKSWQLKGAIEQALTTNDRESIEAITW